MEIAGRSFSRTRPGQGPRWRAGGGSRASSQSTPLVKDRAPISGAGSTWAGRPRAVGASSSWQVLLVTGGEMAQRSTSWALVKNTAACPQSRTLTGWKVFVAEGQLMTQRPYTEHIALRSNIAHGGVGILRW